MTRRDPSCAHVLLTRLLSPAQAITQAELDGFCEADWQEFNELADGHRLGPMLHWLAQRRKGLAFPQAQLSHWQQAAQKASIDVLRKLRELVFIHRQLTGAGIPYIALKGAYLSCHAYPAPGLRPMRDLDILVPPEHCVAAFQLLMDAGATRIGVFKGDPVATFEAGKNHLPPIRSPGGASVIEIHSRLFHDDEPGVPARALPDLSDDPGFWDRAVVEPFGGEPVRYTSPADLLLHLIVHAVHDHQFNNGPLVLSDLAFLVQRQRIDWPSFWQLAERMGRRQGAILALRLMEAHWGDHGVHYPQGVASRVPEDVLGDAAKLMTLRDFAAREEILREQKLADRTWGEKLRFLLSRVVRSRVDLAAMYPVDPRSSRIFLYYPLLWLRLATQSAPEYLRARRKPHVRDEFARIGRVREWLR